MPRRSASDGDWVTLPEAAETLGVHRATVNDMVLSHKLPARRRRGHWYVARADLDEFAARYVRPPNAPPRRERASISESDKAILAMLAEVGPASVGELDRLLTLHDGNIRKHLRLLEADGLVWRDVNGQWRLSATWDRTTGDVLTNA